MASSAGHVVTLWVAHNGRKLLELKGHEDRYESEVHEEGRQMKPVMDEVSPLGPIAPKVALLTWYCFVAYHCKTVFTHKLVILLVVCKC